MSKEQQRAFYGDDDGRPHLSAVVSQLFALTGSEECAVELVEAADEVERVCAGAALTAMPHWIN
jgi:hypothetical protein